MPKLLEHRATLELIESYHARVLTRNVATDRKKDIILMSSVEFHVILSLASENRRTAALGFRNCISLIYL